MKSLAKGISLIRSGSADQLLLKRGDSWKESFGRWTKSGRSADESILISAYGVGNRLSPAERRGRTWRQVRIIAVYDESQLPKLPAKP